MLTRDALSKSKQTVCLLCSLAIPSHSKRVTQNLLFPLCRRLFKLCSRTPDYPSDYPSGSFLCLWRLAWQGGFASPFSIFSYTSISVSFDSFCDVCPLFYKTGTPSADTTDQTDICDTKAPWLLLLLLYRRDENSQIRTAHEIAWALMFPMTW